MNLFHATSPERVDSILAEGLKANFGEVYASDSVEGAARWKVVDVAQGNEIAVIEFKVAKKFVKPGMDHSPIMNTLLKCGPSYVVKGAAPWQIVKVHYCKFSHKDVDKQSEVATIPA